MLVYKHEENNGRCALCGAKWPCALANRESYWTERDYKEAKNEGQS
jgi:hypothetical protein